MSLIFDAGALVGVDRRDRTVGALLKSAQRHGIPVRTSAAAVARVWRDGARQVNLVRALRGFDVVSLDASASHQIGSLLAEAGTTDVVDGHLAVLATDGDDVLTSDSNDLAVLLSARGVSAAVHGV